MKKQRIAVISIDPTDQFFELRIDGVLVETSKSARYLAKLAWAKDVDGVRFDYNFGTKGDA